MGTSVADKFLDKPINGFLRYPVNQELGRSQPLQGVHNFHSRYLLFFIMVSEMRRPVPQELSRRTRYQFGGIKDIQRLHHHFRRNGPRD